MYKNNPEDFNGGNRHGKYQFFFEQLQTDWLGFNNGSWAIYDNKIPIILHESLSVLGTRFHEYIARNIKDTPVFTNIKALDGQGRFLYQPYPIDLHTMRTVHKPSNDPLNRRNQGYLVFGNKLGASGPIKLFGGTFDGLYNLRYTLEKLPNIIRGNPGPLFIDKIAEMSKFKFGIAAENCACQGYLTEKLFDCYIADIVPIYIGGPLDPYLEETVFRVRDLDDIQRAFQMSDLEYLERIEYNRKILFDTRIDFYSCKSVCGEIWKYLPSHIQNKVAQP